MWVLTKSAGKPSLSGLVEHTGKPSGESMELTRKLPSRVLPIRKSHIRQGNSSSGVPKADTYGQVPGCWGGAPVIILYINCGKLTLQFSLGVLYSGAMATFKKFIVSNGYKDSGDSCISWFAERVRSSCVQRMAVSVERELFQCCTEFQLHAEAEQAKG